MRVADMERDEQGKLPGYTSLGGYPMFYLTAAGETVCPGCANKDDTSDPAEHGDVYWEGEPMECDDCGEPIESAYGVPEGS